MHSQMTAFHAESWTFDVIENNVMYWQHVKVCSMRKFRIDQDFLIEHRHMIYIMPVVFAEIYF